MDISPKQVMDLRAATGLPMMKCKQALVSEEGDFEKAMERLRKEGLKAADKKADRATGEGLVRLTLEEDGSAAALVAVVCETEPVRNTPMFQEFVDRLLVHVERYAPDDADAVLAQPWIDDPASTVDEVRRGLVARLGENIQIQRVLRTGPRGTGVVGGYVHFNGKIGTVVVLSAPGANDELRALAKDVAMHVASSKPSALSRDEIPADVKAKEKEIVRAQIEQDPKMAKKPPQVLDKIAEGKMDAFFAAQVLPEQPWFKDGAQTVADVVRAAKAAIERFELVQIGS